MPSSRRHLPASGEQTQLPKAHQPFPLLEEVTRDNFSQVNPLLGLSKMAAVLPAQKASIRQGPEQRFHGEALSEAQLGPSPDVCHRVVL